MNFLDLESRELLLPLLACFLALPLTKVCIRPYAFDESHFYVYFNMQDAQQDIIEPGGNASQVIDHFFRQEWGRVIAFLTGRFGTEQLELIEDAVQDALERAMQHWPYRGVPENPSAWIMQVARNRLIDQLRRAQKQGGQIPEQAETMQSDWEKSLPDDQLNMIFACCHPLLSAEQQVILSLRILLGFGRGEIASALLKKEEAVAKQLVRAKQKLKEANVRMEVPAREVLPERLSVVLRIIYLIFNEGYKASAGDQLLRQDLCMEALRLNSLLLDSPHIEDPDVAALQALMCFQAARLPARLSEAGRLLTLEEQDRRLWDQRLIQEGARRLYQVGQHHHSEYVLQAAMAAAHSMADSYEATNWEHLLGLYDALLGMRPSPVVQLNRMVPFARVHGPEAAIRLLEEHPERTALEERYLFHALLGFLYAGAGDKAKAEAAYQEAASRTENETERDYLLHQAAALAGSGS